MAVPQRFLKPLPLVKPAIVRLRIRRLGVRISSGAHPKPPGTRGFRCSWVGRLRGRTAKSHCKARCYCGMKRGKSDTIHRRRCPAQPSTLERHCPHLWRRYGSLAANALVNKRRLDAVSCPTEENKATTYPLSGSVLGSILGAGDVRQIVELRVLDCPCGPGVQ